mgnify:CR=1 FL=1
MEETEKLLDRLGKDGFDYAILTSAPNVIYASGFEVPYWEGFMGDMNAGLPMTAAVLDVRGRTLTMAASEFYRKKLRRAGLEASTVFYPTFSWEEPVLPEESFSAAIRTILKNLSAAPGSTIGLEQNSTPIRLGTLIQRAVPGAVLKDVTGSAEACRYLKTKREITLLRNAARCADAAQDRLLEISRTPGNYTELELWFEVQKAASAAAGCLVPFVGELVTGPLTGASDYPLGPAARRVSPGDMGIMDISPRVNGYWGDCSNAVVFWAEPNAEQLKYFRAVRAAYEAGRDTIRPGATFGDVTRAMERAYREHGFSLCSYLGHQIGVRVNEKARFTPWERAAILENMVLCIEPQLYTGDAGKTGVRLERMLLVQKDGAEELNLFSWGMES